MDIAEVMHRQISNISVLLFEISRCLASEPGETAQALNQKRMYILEQAVNITNWVSQFDPQNFDKAAHSVPKSLQNLEVWARGALKQYPRPNRIIQKV